MSEALSLEEDGDIGIDWATPERDILSISLRSNGCIMFAVVMSDGRHANGTAQLVPEAFEVLSKIVRKESDEQVDD